MRTPESTSDCGESAGGAPDSPTSGPFDVDDVVDAGAAIASGRNTGVAAETALDPVSGFEGAGGGTDAEPGMSVARRVRSSPRHEANGRISVRCQSRRKRLKSVGEGRRRTVRRRVPSSPSSPEGPPREDSYEGEERDSSDYSSRDRARGGC